MCMEIIQSWIFLGLCCSTEYAAHCACFAAKNWRKTYISTVQVFFRKKITKVHERLRTCALMREEGVTTRLVFAYSDTPGMNDHMCDHSEAERGFVTTATEIELNYALRRCYKVTHLYTYEQALSNKK